MADEAPIINVIPQRGDYDCTVACLAMLAGVSYEEALLALGEQTPQILVRGAWDAEIKRAAAQLGFKLRVRRKFDLENDTGMLRFSDHVVVLRAGLVITTHGSLWDADDFLAYYLHKYKDRPSALLVFEQLEGV